jgi:uncharacterized membrane protein
MPEDKKTAPGKAAPAKAAAGDVSENSRLIAAIGYIIAILVPLYVLLTEKKDDKFLAFHAWQSLLFTVVVIVVEVCLMVIITVAAIATMGVGGFLGSCLALIVWVIIVVLALFLAYKAYKGETYKLPVLGGIAMRQAGG